MGAGAAGLSLLSRLGDPARAVAFDPRTTFGRDRSWCFFRTQPCGFDSAVSHAWPAWKVRLGGREIVRSAPGVEYVHIASDAFYSEALKRIAARSGVTLRLGESVTGVQRVPDGFRLTSAARSVHAKWVFDARPASLRMPVARGEVRLLQHFKGFHVRVDSDVFDPQVATLMDFDVSQADGTAFVYALPFSAREALVEATWFSPAVLPEARYDAAVADWMRARVGVSQWSVLHTERGVIPMTTESLGSEVPAGAFPIGLRGDLAKPSTGYAFLAIQRQSEAIATSLRTGRTPVPPSPRPARTRAIDRVFLSWLAADPGRGAELLFDLFDRVRPSTLVRFLSDEGSIFDDFAVMRRVPSLEFGLATGRTLRRLLPGF